MKILVVNCGSSSIKYKLFNFPKKTLIAKGLIEHIGENHCSIGNHSRGIKMLFDRLLEKRAIKSLDEIVAIGHRVVHGGETFIKPHIVDKRVIEKMKECCKLAPLHNPANLAGIKGCAKILPQVPQVAVFDTSFHHSMPEVAFVYPIPLSYYKKYGVRKYGFHGTSHEYVAHQAAIMLKKPLDKLKLITCHLGNGCSVTAINKGKSVDTSMGYTPLEGLMMGTRSGDIDVAAVFHIMEKGKLDRYQAAQLLNRSSGLLGISGVSNDIRLVISKAKKGHKKSKLAIDMFLYRIKKYIGAYLLILGGVDAVCFTAGIGENNPAMTNKLKKDIQKLVPKTKVLVVPTNEELRIADLSYKLITNGHPVRGRLYV